MCADSDLLVTYPTIQHKDPWSRAHEAVTRVHWEDSTSMMRSNRCDVPKLDVSCAARYVCACFIIDSWFASACASAGCGSLLRWPTLCFGWRLSNLRASKCASRLLNWSLIKRMIWLATARFCEPEECGQTARTWCNRSRWRLHWILGLPASARKSTCDTALNVSNPQMNSTACHLCPSVFACLWVT